MTEIERRARTLTDEDIRAITLATAELRDCRACPVKEEELREAVAFFRNMNDFLTGSKRTIANTLLVALVVFILGLIGLGFWTKTIGG